VSGQLCLFETPPALPFTASREPRPHAAPRPRRTAAHREQLVFSWTAPQPAQSRCKPRLEDRLAELRDAYGWDEPEDACEEGVVFQSPPEAPTPKPELPPEREVAPRVERAERPRRTLRQRREAKDLSRLKRSAEWVNFFELYEDAPLPDWAPLRLWPEVERSYSAARGLSEAADMETV
jgi:hypothetical protein